MDEGLIDTNNFIASLRDKKATGSELTVAESMVIRLADTNMVLKQALDRKKIPVLQSPVTDESPCTLAPICRHFAPGS